MGALGSQLPTVEAQMKSKGGHVGEDAAAVPDDISPASNATPITGASTE